MCGRFALRVPRRKVARTFGVPEPRLPFDLAPRYNIAPTQPVLAVRQPGLSADREGVWLRWGLVPPWAKDPKAGARHVNARSETAAERPAFRHAFRKRRCLILADGFYEWRAEGKKKQPYLFALKDGEPFGLARLWGRWEGEDGEEVESCTILTTEPNKLVRRVHDRMPVLLDPKHYATWLDPEEQDPERLEKLLRPYPATRMAVLAVSPVVNNARNEGPECVRPLETEE